ncbi:MAG: VOC family protein [Aureispira sp.]
MQLQHLHHIAVICSNYAQSKAFYTQVLGLEILQEVYRAERDSYKLDLALNGTYILELFSFPNPPARPSRPEATGLRHLAFGVADVVATRQAFLVQGYAPEAIRRDEHTGKLFFFVHDPDALPLEFYETI